ncbi:ribonuclease Y [bacterium]|nr:ribonuclease Y [bacterium]
MEFNVLTLLIALIACAGGFYARKIISEKGVNNARNEAEKILRDAENEIAAKRREMDLEFKDKYLKSKADFERETKERRNELNTLEKRIMQKEENLDRKVDMLDQKEIELKDKDRELTRRLEQISIKDKELAKMIEDERNQLQSISGLSVEEAKNLLLKNLEAEVTHEAATIIRQIDADMRSKAEKLAKNIVSQAIQRCAAEHVSETTVTTVSLPSDEMKGRIIGREGRNIRALEAATGVDIIIDDTPEVVILSGFDLVRREVAKRTLVKLIEDGRIHPARIEEIVKKVQKELDQNMREAGEQAAFDLGIHGLHPELIYLLGRMQYRTSYGQNILKHSCEVARIMGIMASELGLDAQIAKRCGLLHDIGKALTHEIEGPHAQIGMEYCKKYGESEIVYNAVGCHHGDIEAISIYGILTTSADAISAARPGARSETISSYINRLEKLEELATSFTGVDKAYAIQAGREIRVIAKPDELDDDASLLLARNLASKIQEEMQYPGQIRVVVIRETRNIEYAK